METIECIKNRRSIRRFRDETVDDALIRQIVSAASYAPSWKNTQICRYNIVRDAKKIRTIANEGVLGFAPNSQTIGGCAALVVLSYVSGRSGYERDGSFSTSKGDRWQMFDAGIAAQTFCLAAWEYGIGSVMLGLFNEDFVAGVVGIPENETVAALIAIGYPDQVPAAPKRKDPHELMRLI